jgi:hypothetical protein
MIVFLNRKLAQPKTTAGKNNIDGDFEANKTY